ncbi:TetR/AcrR family transcriptional regulator [Streptomyces sp. NPDC102274]|uniref:TetR/AcrR family transcriptional regulator n=1 Tax=Streptomyces sp. NPDC102274 TaxID=3366151 RepID=UPI0037FAF410
MTPGKQPPARRLTTRRALIIREVLDKATELFGEQGYDKTTLQDIATAIGISRSALYHYVSSKEQILATLMDELSVALNESIATAHEGADSPEDRLRTLSAELVRQRAERPGPFRLLNQAGSALPESVRAQQAEVRGTVLDELCSVIEEGMAAGVFKPLDPRVAALSIVGMCNWVAWWFHPGIGLDVEATTRQVAQAAVDIVLKDDQRDSPYASPRHALDAVRACLDTLEQLLPCARRVAVAADGAPDPW